MDRCELFSEASNVPHRLPTNGLLSSLPVNDITLPQDLQGRGTQGEEQAKRLRDFFMALAVCHTVIPEKFEDSDEVRAPCDPCIAVEELGGIWSSDS